MRVGEPTQVRRAKCFSSSPHSYKTSRNRDDRAIIREEVNQLVEETCASGSADVLLKIYEGREKELAKQLRRLKNGFGNDAEITSLTANLIFADRNRIAIESDQSANMTQID